MKTKANPHCMGCGSVCQGKTYTDPLTLRAYCRSCCAQEKLSSRAAMMTLLEEILPMGFGSRVECRDRGTDYVGTGYIVGSSTELINGGTPDSPAYLVNLDGTTDCLWFTSNCLNPVTTDEE